MKKLNLRQYVSDHALVRFIERVHGVSLDEIREALLDDGVLAAVKAGATKITKEGVEYRLKDGKVVTVIAEGDKQ